MSLLHQYAKAMRNGNQALCIQIERDNDLFGWTPELVSIGLKAIDEGKDPIEAINAYCDTPIVTDDQVAGMDSQAGVLK